MFCVWLRLWKAASEAPRPRGKFRMQVVLLHDRGICFVRVLLMHNMCLIRFVGGSYIEATDMHRELCEFSGWFVTCVANVMYETISCSVECNVSDEMLKTFG